MGSNGWPHVARGARRERPTALGMADAGSRDGARAGVGVLAARGTNEATALKQQICYLRLGGATGVEDPYRAMNPQTNAQSRDYSISDEILTLSEVSNRILHRILGLGPS